VNEDFAVYGESKSDTKWLLESNHVLVQVHFEWSGVIGHCENPNCSAIGAKKVLLILLFSTSSRVESYSSTVVVGAEIFGPPKRRLWRTMEMEMESSESRGLNLQRRGHFGD
jgi:hypothetical protein